VLVADITEEVLAAHLGGAEADPDLGGRGVPMSGDASGLVGVPDLL